MECDNNVETQQGISFLIDKIIFNSFFRLASSVKYSLFNEKKKMSYKIV